MQPGFYKTNKLCLAKTYLRLGRLDEVSSAPARRRQVLFAFDVGSPP